MSKWHGGKGSSRRKEDKKKIDDNWDKIFKKKVEPITKEDIGKYAHPAYTRYPHLKDLEKALEDLNKEIHGENDDD
jgi:hypothetical protein